MDAITVNTSNETTVEDDEEAELRKNVPLAYQKACRIAGLMGALDIALDESDILTSRDAKEAKATGAIIHLVDVLREEAEALADLLDRASIVAAREAA